MEVGIEEKKETTIREEKKGKGKWGSLILNFLIYGGWLLVVAVVIGITKGSRKCFTPYAA